MSTNQELIYQLDNGVATITLNRPERKNTLSTSLLNKLANAWEEVDKNDEIKVVVLTSTDCGVFLCGNGFKRSGSD